MTFHPFSENIFHILERDVNDVSCAATIKHECCTSTVACIPEIALRNVSAHSRDATIKHECCTAKCT